MTELFFFDFYQSKKTYSGLVASIAQAKQFVINHPARKKSNFNKIQSVPYRRKEEKSDYKNFPDIVHLNYIFGISDILYLHIVKIPNGYKIIDTGDKLGTQTYNIQLTKKKPDNKRIFTPSEYIKKFAIKKIKY